MQIRLAPCLPGPYNSQTRNGARSSAVEHYLHTVGVTGSKPVAPTISRYNPGGYGIIRGNPLYSPVRVKCKTLYAGVESGFVTSHYPGGLDMTDFAKQENKRPDPNKLQLISSGLPIALRNTDGGIFSPIGKDWRHKDFNTGLHMFHSLRTASHIGGWDSEDRSFEIIDCIPDLLPEAHHVYRMTDTARLSDRIITLSLIFGGHTMRDNAFVIELESTLNSESTNGIWQTAIFKPKTSDNQHIADIVATDGTQAGTTFEKAAARMLTTPRATMPLPIRPPAVPFDDYWPKLDTLEAAA